MKSKILISTLLAAIVFSANAFAHDDEDRHDHRRWEERRHWEDQRRWEERRRWEEQRREEERRDHWRREHRGYGYERADYPPPPPPAYGHGYRGPQYYNAEPPTVRLPMPPLILPPSPRQVEHALRDLFR